ncbi:DUF1090 domain-containing protein [Vibrio mediterranei]|uniref:DUF1090 domain-containing protein n=1 Tax=Vibrio mediterranei TaxID=689 RepID=UPI00148E2700|nr:DUF1090 domain-containing protein [Vibrio mediterranei]NOH29675.1 DUF1090 domain-containing protein [Vibrio mediterranei]
MRKMTLTLLALTLAVSGSVSAQEALTGCAAKEQRIKTKLEYAKKYNNTHEIQSLELAIENVQNYCTDEKLYEERMQKVESKKKKVAERAQDLEQAKAKGDQKKIKKKERKLADAEEELQEAISELSE